MEKKQKNHFDYYINKCYGITQDPITKDFMVIINYCGSGDLNNYITSKFDKTSWRTKLYDLMDIIKGLEYTHRDFHSRNILIDDFPKIGDLGLSKSATASDEIDNIYGVIPYIAPEVFQGKKYTMASDIYSFGMIMWEFMTSRRPFCNRNHDKELIIDICDGLRPPIVTNAPKGYNELMQECWNYDPNKRPTTAIIEEKLTNIRDFEYITNNLTEIIRPPDIGPITTNNPGACPVFVIIYIIAKRIAHR